MGLTDRCEPMDFRTGGMGGGEGEEEVCARGESFLRADFPRRDRAADLRVSGLECCYSIFFYFGWTDVYGEKGWLELCKVRGSPRC